LFGSSLAESIDDLSHSALSKSFHTIGGAVKTMPMGNKGNERELYTECAPLGLCQ
jgi:hypothetical protein